MTNLVYFINQDFDQFGTEIMRMQVFSNGEYSSIEHRAVVNNVKERLSIAAFHSPHIDTDIAPLPELVQDNSPKYKTIRHIDFIRLVLGSHLDGKSILDYLKL